MTFLAPLLLGSALALTAPDPTPPSTPQEASRTLVVATKEAAPFSFRDGDSWRGISIDLWRNVAEGLGWQYELRETSLEDLVDGLERGDFDASVAALTMTAARETRIDFSHPFHSSGLGIVTPIEGSVWVGVLKRVLSLRFVQAVGSLAVLIFLAGLVVWMVERRKNPEEFGGSIAQGLASGFWWSAVTMTTVGYGDKSPRTHTGRAVALVWMFASVITISGLTATIASTLTVTQLGASVDGPQDLPKLGRIATVESSTSETYLREARIAYDSYPTPREALAALAKGEHQALVYDAPILRYLVNRDYSDDLIVLPGSFERQDYAIGLPDGSVLREPLNRAILEELTARRWQALLDDYLGPTE